MKWISTGTVRRKMPQLSFCGSARLSILMCLHVFTDKMKPCLRAEALYPAGRGFQKLISSATPRPTKRSAGPRLPPALSCRFSEQKRRIEADIEADFRVPQPVSANCNSSKRCLPALLLLEPFSARSKGFRLGGPQTAHPGCRTGRNCC